MADYVILISDYDIPKYNIWHSRWRPQTPL